MIQKIWVKIITGHEGFGEKLGPSVDSVRSGFQKRSNCPPVINPPQNPTLNATLFLSPPTLNFALHFDTSLVWFPRSEGKQTHSSFQFYNPSIPGF
jgi:hypothetical protein